MSQRIHIGREFRCRMKEESKSSNRVISRDFISESATLAKFREEALAIDERGYRIPGRNPTLLMEECSIREIAAETIINRHTGEPVGLGFIAEMFGND